MITITINKSEVLDEVSKTTAYIGAKSQDAATYRRIATVKANDELLEGYWQECRSGANIALSRWLATDSSTDSRYQVSLQPSLSWASALQCAVGILLKSYFVNSILGKWLAVCGSAGAEGYVQLAENALKSAQENMYQLRSPERP